MSSSQTITSTPSIVHPSTDILLSESQGPVTQGGLLSCNAVAWLVVENSLIIVDAVNGKTIQSWRPPPEAGEIIHVVEFSLGDRQLLIVGLDHNGCGVIVVLSPNTTKLLRAFEVPDSVTSIHAFSSSIFASYVDGYYLPDLFQYSALGYFSGVVAVGCHGGKVYLINLHLNLGDNLSHSSLGFSKLYLIEECTSVDKIRTIGEGGQHACVLLTRDCCRRNDFIYQKQSFNPNAVKVTALHLISQIRCLCVGYSFGSFQIYSLCPMMVVCSSPISQDVAVTHFAYMEPENDPRCFVYLWVATGMSPLIEESVGSETKVSLYQMIFADKIPSSRQLGTVYHNLQSCILRLEYALTSTPSTPNPRASVGSYLLKCFTVQLDHQVRGLEESREGPNRRLDQTISVFVWASGEEYLLGLFDINQWYQAQMPNTFHWKRSGKYTGVLGCSYFTCYSLKLLKEQDTTQIMSKQFFDVSLSNLLPFNSLSPVPETHTWPTSLSFNLTALSESNIHHCECYGLQRLTLYELDLCRGALYAQPERFFNMCMQAEMLLHHWEYASGLIDLNLQRKALLTVLVEWDCPTRVIGAFVEGWLSSGDGAPLVTEWLSHKLTKLAGDIEALRQALIGGSTLTIPLSSYWRQLAAVINLIEKILNYISVSDMGEDSVFLCFDELYCKAITQQRVLEVVMFLISHNLAGGSEKISVPYAAISQRYDHLRGRGENKQLLAVDYLCEEINQPYPPQSLEALLAVFETSNILVQHYLMLYWLCELGHAVDDGQLHLLNRYINMQCLPPRLGVLVHTLWLLDNRSYHKLEKFLWLIPKEVTPAFSWYHGVMIDGLLQDGKNSLALCYIENFGAQMQLIDDVKAKIRVLVFNQKFDAAHELMMQYDGSGGFEDLFNHFLMVNYKVKSLHLIIYLPFSEVEEKLFITYLSQHENIVVREILILYFLWQHRFAEAMAVHEQIKLLVTNDYDPKTAQMYVQCETILKGFIATVPKTFERVTAEHQSSTRVTAEVSSGSLSSVVAKAAAHEGQIGSQAGLIYTVLQSIAESRTNQTVPLTPLRSRPGNGAKDMTAVPFLSTPMSIKKARSNTCGITFASNQKTTPTSLITHTPHMLECTPFASFQAHMLSFRDRFASMLDKSTGSNALDISNIYTPTTATSGLLSKPLLSVVTPPSILKGRLSVSKQSGAEGKKIRFAVESPVVTPFQERSRQRQLPSSYTPAAVSSLTTTAVSMAASTPLPISDDSDQFESPAESPSQLKECSVQNTAKPPRFQLDEDDEIVPVQRTPYGSQEVHVAEDKPDIVNDKDEDSHRNVEQSLDDDGDNGVPSEAAVPELQGKLTRDSVSSMMYSSQKVQSPHELFAKPTPPVHVASPCTEPARIFSPIPMLSELVESKKVKLMKSLDETKKRHTAAIKDQRYFSPTMVKRTTGSEISTTTSTLHGTQYSFSPPTEMHDHQLAKSPTSEADNMASFVFSPPLTRSAARRIKEKGGDLSLPVSDSTSTAKKGRGKRPSSTPLRETTPVALITPPSYPSASTASTREEGKQVKRIKPVKSGVQTRRSARLLTGKK